MCVCFYVWLGVCRWCCADYVLWLFDIWMGDRHLCIVVVGLCWLSAWGRLAGPPFSTMLVLHLVSITVPMWGIISGYAGLCLSLHCTVGITDPMHARILLFSVCWVWYYTYLVMCYLFNDFGLLYSTMPCCVETFIALWSFHSSILYSVRCWTSLSGVSSVYSIHFRTHRCKCLCICFYVFSITPDRLVLYVVGAMHSFGLSASAWVRSSAYALTGIFRFCRYENTQYWLYTLVCLYRLVPLPSPLVVASSIDILWHLVFLVSAQFLELGFYENGFCSTAFG